MIIRNARVYTPDGHFIKKDLHLDGAYIRRHTSDPVEIDANGLYAIPGLIDIHLHGCMGHDFCDAAACTLDTMAAYQACNGVTGFVPASMTLSEEKLSGIFQNAAHQTQETGAMLLGVNMEGPFLAETKKGAQNARYLIPPDIPMFRRLNAVSGGRIKLVTLAPELAGASEFITALKDETVLSLGHTEASYETAFNAFELGASHVTHLFNAMPPFNHREPGLIGAAFDHPGVTAELICDNVHVAPAIVRAAFKLFTAERIVLVSDSMRAAGLADGAYTLGGQAVQVCGNRAALADGTLAGSVTNLMDCLRNAVSFGIPLADAVRAAAVNPARVIGESDRLGSLEPGKLANVVLLDKKLNVVKVFVKGKCCKDK
ncbi:N-acetylglucosamine-6-phosphate deacetylase [Eubacterium sp. 1001713B170207_170306_E7]|uniref:N-acetylglucosamine-6-phosphate deacetylase n=1 Tax=Eubacterium sp. 1001713B170207_170306_E7 TaxID=2787097 RepID=UPI00189B50C7|nr:N-acetylglucosamine-6-phosphate deacetylase [Eubacterium sp. 1001713B170207_170306_E7]